MLVRWRRMPMEAESPEELGYDTLRVNLAESSCRDRRFGALGLDLDDLVLLYGDHRGNPDLRAGVAAEAGLPAEACLLTTGAAMALFLVSACLLGPEEHLVVVRPNYATNLETPYALRADVTALDLRLEDGFWLDLDRVAAALRPDTRLVSVTTPHNPSGVGMDRATLDGLVRLVERQGCHLLVDETYRDLGRAPLPVAASLSPRAISVASVSKTYGLPGIRVGWVLTGDPALQARLLAAKEQIVLTGSVLDEAIAAEVWRRRSALLPAILDTTDRARDRVLTWIAGEPRLEVVRPDGGVVAFPRIRADAGVDVAGFYCRLRERRVLVGPGHWFDQDPRHFRIGWGWPTPEELEEGLAALGEALDG